MSEVYYFKVGDRVFHAHDPSLRGEVVSELDATGHVRVLWDGGVGAGCKRPSELGLDGPTRPLAVGERVGDPAHKGRLGAVLSDLGGANVLVRWDDEQLQSVSRGRLRRVDPVAEPANDEDLATQLASRDEVIQHLQKQVDLCRQQLDDARAERDEARTALANFEKTDNYVRTALATLGAEIERQKAENWQLRAESARRRDEQERAASAAAQANMELARLRRDQSDGGVVPREIADRLANELAHLKTMHETVNTTNSKMAEENTRLRESTWRWTPAVNRLSREARAYIDVTGGGPAASSLSQAINEALGLVTAIGDPPLPFNMAAFFDAKVKWSNDTFGPGDRYQGVIAHIRKELDEIAAKPTDLTEWIDVVLLAMDGAWRSADANGARFVEALVKKDAKNRARTWPDWRTIKPNEVSEHIEPNKAAPAPPEFAPGTEVLFGHNRTRGRIVGPSKEPSFGAGWYEIAHDPWAPGGTARTLCHRDSISLWTSGEPSRAGLARER